MEMCLIGTVGAGSMTTSGACLRSLAWVYPYNRNSSLFGFVDNHVRKLPKGPIAHHAVETFAAPHSVANAIQLFKDNDRVRCASNDVDQFAANFMVDIFSPIGLSALIGPDFVRSSLSSHALAILLESSLSVLGGFTRPELDDARADQRCHFCYPQVHTEELNIVTDGWYVGRIADRQLGIPLAISLEDLSITPGERKRIQVAFGDTERKPDVLPTLTGRDTQGPSITITEQLVGITAKADGQVAVDYRP